MFMHNKLIFCLHFISSVNTWSGFWLSWMCKLISFHLFIIHLEILPLKMGKKWNERKNVWTSVHKILHIIITGLTGLKWVLVQIILFFFSLRLIITVSIKSYSSNFIKNSWWSRDGTSRVLENCKNVLSVFPYTFCSQIQPTSNIRILGNIQMLL